MIAAVFPSAFFAIGAFSHEPALLTSDFNLIVNSTPSSKSVSPEALSDILISSKGCAFTRSKTVCFLVMIASL